MQSTVSFRIRLRVSFDRATNGVVDGLQFRVVSNWRVIGDPKHIYMVAAPTVTSRVLEVACEYLCVQVCEKSERGDTGRSLFIGFLLGIIFTFSALAWIEYTRNARDREFQIVTDSPSDRRRGINQGRSRGSAIG
jgi:hypothetical protein